MVGPKSIASNVLEKSADYAFVNVMRVNEKVLKVIIQNNFEIKWKFQISSLFQGKQNQKVGLFCILNFAAV